MIEVNVDNTGAVIIGDKSIKQYRKFKTVKALISFLNIHEEVKSKAFQLMSSDVKYSNNYKKAYNKSLCDKLGRSAPQFLKHVNGLIYKQFVSQHNNKHVKAFCLDYRKREVDSFKLNKLKKTEQLLEEVDRDGIYHIAPAVYATCSSPSTLKKAYGKGLWKQISGNSFSRNKLLFCSDWGVDNVEYLKNKNLLPTTLLKQLRCDPIHLKFMLWAKDHLRGNWGKKNILKDAYNVWSDTQRLLPQIGIEFNQAWGYKRMKEEHDKAAAIITARKFSKDKYEWCSNMPSCLEVGEYTVNLLDNNFAIAEEGNNMHHCVAGYTSMSARGEYVVYSVLKDGERYSTIGLYRDVATCKVTFNQHYKKFNQRVDCEIAKSIPQKLMEIINK